MLEVTYTILASGGSTMRLKLQGLATEKSIDSLHFGR